MYQRIFTSITLLSTIVLVSALALRGMGLAVDEGWIFFTLQVFHASIAFAGIFLLVEAVGKKRVGQLVLTIVALVLFAVTFVFYLLHSIFPPILLIVFDFYLILGCSAYLALSIRDLSEKPQTIHF